VLGRANDANADGCMDAVGISGEELDGADVDDFGNANGLVVIDVDAQTFDDLGRTGRPEHPISVAIGRARELGLPRDHG
jgi:hypothetical protein